MPRSGRGAGMQRRPGGVQERGASTALMAYGQVRFAVLSTTYNTTVSALIALPKPKILLVCINSPAPGLLSLKLV